MISHALSNAFSATKMSPQSRIILNISTLKIREDQLFTYLKGPKGCFGYRDTFLKDLIAYADVNANMTSENTILIKGSHVQKVESFIVNSEWTNGYMLSR